MLVVEHVSYAYPGSGELALQDVSVTVQPGQWVAIIGPNGSGKSTLTRLMYGLVLPATGSVTVAGLDLHTPTGRMQARRKMGLVLQNPDHQLVAARVEEDVAFGPENLNLPPEEIRHRVQRALAAVSLEHLRDKPPHLLSGGEKQRLALAGVLALQPHYLILDEPTSMLDPRGRRDMMAILRRLSLTGMAVAMVTHHMDEAALADLVWVLDKGQLVAGGTPEHVFGQPDLLLELGLELPWSAGLARDLAARGVDVPRGTPVTMEDLVNFLCTALKSNS